MVHMQPGNSFPQICVVSEIHSAEVLHKPQDYRYLVDLSNQSCLLMSNGSRMDIQIAPPLAIASVISAAIILAALIRAAIFDAGGLQQSGA